MEFCVWYCSAIRLYSGHEWSVREIIAHVWEMFVVVGHGIIGRCDPQHGIVGARIFVAKGKDICNGGGFFKKLRFNIALGMSPWAAANAGPEEILCDDPRDCGVSDDLIKIGTPRLPEISVGLREQHRWQVVFAGGFGNSVTGATPLRRSRHRNTRHKDVAPGLSWLAAN